MATLERIFPGAVTASAPLSFVSGRAVNSAVLRVTVAIYIRISSEEQKSGWSVDAQLRECKRMAEQRGYTVQDEYVYVDEGFSGKTIKRPGFRKMLDAAKERRFAAIITHKLDRFSRSVVDILEHVKLLNSLDVTLVCADSQFDPSTANGRMMMTILAAFAEWYVQNLAQETTKGKYERFLQGYHNGRLPNGYAMPKTMDPAENMEVVTGNRWIARKTKQIEGVILAFELYATGAYSDADIAEELNKRKFTSAGQPNRRGAPIYTKETVWDMLQNPFYAGWVSYVGEGEKRKKRQEQKVQRRKGLHEAAITQELFDRCQQIRSTKRAKGMSVHKHIHPHLFGRQIARCRACGQPLRTENHFLNQNLHYMRCTSVISGIVCTASQKRVPAEHATRQIANLVSALVLPEDWRQRLAAQLNGDVERDTIATQMGRLKEQQRRLNVQFESEAITDVEFRNRMAEIKAQLAQLAEARAEQPSLVEASELLEAMPLVWRGATDQERQDLLRRLASTIIVDTDTRCAVEIHPHPPYVTLFRAIPGIKEIGPGRFEVPDVEHIEPIDRRRRPKVAKLN